MAELQRAVATLRIKGDDLIPNEVSALLGIEPTKSQTKGEKLPTQCATPRIARFGFWCLGTADTEPADLDQQVSELLANLTSDLDVWNDIASRLEIDLFCG